MVGTGFAYGRRVDRKFLFAERLLMQTLFDETSKSAGPERADGEERTNVGRSLRIVHVVSSLKVGGMEQVVLSLVEAQLRDGHAVSILALNGGSLEEAAKQRHLPVRILGQRDKVSRIFFAAWHLARMRPDIVHAHNPTSLHYAIMGKIVGRARVLMTDHNQGKGVVRVPSALERHFTDAAVAVSQHTADKAILWGWKRPATVIHNGVRFVPSTLGKVRARAKLGLDQVPVGIMVARFDKLKGHSILLHALAMLREWTVPVTMLIVGDGAERENIERQAQVLQLPEERVRFLGTRSDIDDLLAAADFFVLPSLMEGFPLAVLEAMTAELPVITTPVGGIPELVEDEVNGVLISANDPDALARAIESFARSPELRARLGRAGGRRVNAEFTFQHMTSKYERLYHSLIDAN